MEEEKVLDLFWDVKNDEIYIKFARKDVDLQFLSNIKIKLKFTLRIALSFHAKTHDPIGLVLPTCMICALLFRVSLQLIKKEVRGKIPWDEVLPEDLVDKWVEHFEI